MAKPTWKQRAQWLKDIRSPYLNFIRNFTPQVGLATLAFYISTKLDINKIDLGNWPTNFVFLILLGSFFFAFWANTTSFYNDAFSDLIKWSADQISKCDVDKLTGPKFLKEMVCAMWRERAFEFLMFVLLIIFFEIAFVGIVYTAIGSTIGLMHTMKL